MVNVNVLFMVRIVLGGFGSDNKIFVVIFFFLKLIFWYIIKFFLIGILFFFNVLR